MGMHFEELDGETRGFMSDEFEIEQNSGMQYGGRRLTNRGRAAFPDLMRTAIKSGSEVTLEASLLRSEFWHSDEDYERSGVVRVRRINLDQAAAQLALSEFNTCYVRGVSKRLLSEGVEFCQVYRGAYPKWEPGECAEHEGRVLPTAEVYAAHRARYWPPPGDPSRFSIPFSPGCHHTIRRFHGKSKSPPPVQAA